MSSTDHSSTRVVFYKRVQVEVYNSYLTRSHICIRARVLLARNIKTSERDRWLPNLVNSFKRLNTNEVPRVTIEVLYADQLIASKADSEGYIEIFEPRHKWPIVGVSDDPAFTIKFPEQTSAFGPLAEQNLTCYFTVLSGNYSYGVISDIDDTIMMTGVTSRFKWRVIYNSFFINPFKRLSFDKTASFYQKLVKNKKGPCPVFYVSNSPWNFYTYLKSFIKHHHFPDGILMLRDLKVDFSRKVSFRDHTKYREVEQVLTALPKMPFYLIGDAGELDPYIYLEFVKKMPHRIKGVYIRTVGDSRKNDRIRRLFADQDSKIFYVFENIEELDILINPIP